MSNRKDFYFRQIVTEDDVNNAFNYAEQGDHNFTVDADFKQKTDTSNIPLSTPAGTDFNALLGGIVNGLNVTISGTAATISAGVAYDGAGQRICVTAPITVSMAVTGDTVVGAGGTPAGIGSVSTTPASGQFIWILLQVYFNRLLSDPREDGNDATVYFDSAESFQFRVKASTSSATPSQPAGDPGCVILGLFKINSGNTIGQEDYSTRGDWLRTYAVYTTGTLPTNQTENGTTTDSNFIAGTARQAILKLRNTIGLSTTNYTNHINQSAPQDRHAAKNIDYDASLSAWADGTNPALGSNLGGGVDGDGVQWAIDQVISLISDTTIGFGGTKKLGGASISGSPVTIAAGTIRSQLTSLLTGLNNHLNATTAAHAATAISVAAGTTLVATDVGNQLGALDAYLTGRVDNATLLSGSNASPIWRNKNARGYTGAIIDHLAFFSGRIMEIRENWVFTNGVKTALGTGLWFNNWNYGLFGSTTGSFIAVQGPVLSGPTNHPFGPLCQVSSNAASGDSANVLEMSTPVLGPITQALMMDFDISVNSGSLHAGASYAVGFGDGTLVSSATTNAITGSGADPVGAYIMFTVGVSANAITTRTKVGASTSTNATSTLMAIDQPHRIRIEIIPNTYSDDGNHHVIYYVDGVQIQDDTTNMTSTIPYPFIRTSSLNGSSSNSFMCVGPMRIMARLATGDVTL